MVVRQVQRRHRVTRTASGRGRRRPRRVGAASGVAYLGRRGCCAALSHDRDQDDDEHEDEADDDVRRPCEWVSSCQARTVAISRIQTMETGIRTFQPSAMSWSYRIRGSVPRSQM